MTSLGLCYSLEHWKSITKTFTFWGWKIVRECVKNVSDVEISFISELAWNDLRIWITLDLGNIGIFIYVSLCAHKVFVLFFFPSFYNTSNSLTRFGRAHPKHSCFMLRILPCVQFTFYNSLYWAKISLWDLRNFNKISLPTDRWCSWKGLSKSYSVWIDRFITCQQEFSALWFER